MATSKNDKRRVLLVEPNYRNKYPPLGLMKLATYHRNRGDEVSFFKGDLRDLIVKQYVNEAIRRFHQIDEIVDWWRLTITIFNYIKYGRKKDFDDILKNTCFGAAIGNWLKNYRKICKTGCYDNFIKWDRICVTTLFTFHWKITAETIALCKQLIKDPSELFVGGIMASVIPEEVEQETGIRPIVGLLDKPGILDPEDATIIDELIPDYSILEEIDYVYPENNAYYAYTTRGCIRKCSFCAVPRLEPRFKNYIPLRDNLNQIDVLYGKRQHLLLLDNNVLASKKFPDIIREIREAGFIPGAKYLEPNYLKIAIEKMKDGINVPAYQRLAHHLLIKFFNRLKKNSLIIEKVKHSSICFVPERIPSSKELIDLYNDISELYERYTRKIAKLRYVDFNQGIDARLIDEKKMALLASIPIRPLRIAFDSMDYAEIYEKAIRLAHKHGIKHLSNYLLFNFDEKPVELYQRLRLNVELCEELHLPIYSFPMRYTPIWDRNGMHHTRNYIGLYWNKKFIRAIQCILNATKGKIGRKLDFFEAAFGKNEEEYFQILYMPEAYIMQRNKSRDLGLTDAWLNIWNNLDNDELNAVIPIIKENNFSNLKDLGFRNPKIKILLDHYMLSNEQIQKEGIELKRMTYDFGMIAKLSSGSRSLPLSSLGK